MVAPCSVPRVALLLLVLAACAGWCDSAAGQPAARAANSTAADVAALQSLKAAVDGGNTTLSSWKGTNPCGTLAWKGVNCTDGRVTQISLAGLNLTGTLPKEWGMQKLLALDLSNNSLGAGLPGGWDLPALAALALGLNQLTGSLPEAWAAGLPALASLDLRFNNLAGSVPGSWASTGFAPPFTALLQPGKTDGLCGVVFPKPGYSLLYQTLQSNQTHALYGAIGSCQCCNCGQARINGSATNAYDVAWANSIAPTDLGAANSDLQVNVVPAPGTPLTLPCYPSNPPTFFGANAALRGNAWQSSTSGNATAYLAVAGAKAIPQPPGDCSATDAVPGWWMVDLQNADTAVHGVALTVGTPMTDVEVRVGNNVNPAANVRCTAPSNRTLTAGTGAIILCDRLTLKGRYLSVNASSRVSLCKVQVYPYIANAALGKPTTFSAASGGNEANADKATDGSVATSSCTQIVNDKNLAAWLTIDLLYEAAVEMVVVVNGDSTFNSDLVIRLGNSPVVRGDENGVCSLNQSLAPRKTLPVQCDGRGRYLTLYRKAPGASDLYICEVFAYLKEGPTGFLGSTAAPSPAPAPSPTSPAPSPPPATVISVTINTVEMEVALQLTGPGLVPVTPDVQQQIAAALSNSWTTIDGVDGVRVTAAAAAGNGTARTAARRRLTQAPAAPAPAPAAGAAAPSPAAAAAVFPTVLVKARVDVSQGEAPSVANAIANSVLGAQTEQALADAGLPSVSVVATAITSTAEAEAHVAGSPPDPPGSATSGGSSASVGAIVGGVVGGLAVVAALAAGYVLYRRRRGAAAAAGSQPPSPKLGSLESGDRPKGAANGFSVSAQGAGSAPLKVDPKDLTQGPSSDVIAFLSIDESGSIAPPSLGATPRDGGGGGARGAPAPGSQPPSRQPTLRPTDSGVSELWTVDYGELEMQKQIGEGSFGKVHLAKWRETTVAVKVLAPQDGGGTVAPVDEEFPAPAAPPSRAHPFYESLQKEAAMMASLRHPSIVMYMGVCLDPPAVVTEYCARGSLNDVLKRARTTPVLAQQLDWPRRLNMALDAAKGMLYLHSCTPPIIHRDLKSPNLLVDKHWRVKVCDFNLSRVMEDSVVFSSVAATNPRWLAPEILSGKGYTFASDVYSFGIILWELLTWQVPWHDCGPWQVVAMVTEGRKRPEVPPAPEALPTPGFAGLEDYVQLMQECWAQEPGDRPTFAAVISRLRTLLARETQLARLRHGSPARARGGGGSSLGFGGPPSSVSGAGPPSSAGGDETPSLRSAAVLSNESPSPSPVDSNSLLRVGRRLHEVFGTPDESQGSMAGAAAGTPPRPAAALALGRSSGGSSAPLPPPPPEQQPQQQQWQAQQQHAARPGGRRVTEDSASSF